MFTENDTFNNLSFFLVLFTIGVLVIVENISTKWYNQEKIIDTAKVIEIGSCLNDSCKVLLQKENGQLIYHRTFIPVIKGQKLLYSCGTGILNSSECGWAPAK